MSSQFIVNGKITQPDVSSLPSVMVRAFNKGLPSLGVRGEQQLGKDAMTDAEGNYEIIFTEEDFSGGESRRGKVRPDLLIRVFDGDTLLGESKIHFHAGPGTRIDLTVKVPERSEYETLVRRITPILQGIAIGDLTDEDLAFIHGETKIEPGRLKLLRLSAQLARKASAPADSLYGLGRQGLALDVDKLIGMPDEKLIEAVVKAAKAKIIPSQSRDQAGGFIRQLKRVNYVVYQATLRLRDDKNNSNLSNYKVQVFESNSHGKPEPLTTILTDGAGTFAFNYSTPRASSKKRPIHKFLLKVSASNGTEIPDTTVELMAGDQQIVRVPVAVPEPKIQPAPAVSKIAGLAKVSIPKKLQSFLSENNIRTLADIRKTGGLGGLKGLPVEPDHAAVQALEAHADLSRLSADVQVNASLIAKGYSSVAAIADAPRSTFVAATHETLGDFNAARMHAVARAQTAFLDNVLIGAAAAQKTVAGPDAAGAALPLLDQQCTCEDCESAISPAFYLADLLKYATDHIQRDGQKVDLQFLVDTFHQPFDALQVSCEAVNQPVRSARICAEILRAYLGPRPLNDPQKESALQQVELEYLTGAYTQLLHQVGTSYDEIRLARTDSEDNRNALAERLGIELTSPLPAAGDELDGLFLTFPDVIGSSATLDQLRTLERQIEQLFGLVDTRKDPLSDGVKFGDDDNTQLLSWSLRGAEWGRNTDPDGNVYVTFENPDQATFDVKLYRDTQRTQLVAASKVVPRIAGDAVFRLQLLPENDSNLNGSFAFLGGYPAPAANISIALIPNFLSWRLKHLRTTWAQEDYPVDPYASGNLPLIDPDLIGPDDFRSPVPKASASAPNTTAFDLWLTRRGAIDTILNTLQRDRETNADGLTLILKEVFGDPLPDFDSLLQELTRGDKDTVKAATGAISNLNLTVDSFMRLMDIRSKDAQSRGGPGDPVNPDEWNEAYAILTQVRKLRLFSAWRAEEEQLNIILGMRDFWVSLREPAEGAWPPPQLLSAQTPAAPLIDPDLQTLKDLPEPVAGAPAITLWADRSAKLKTINATLASTRQSSGFEAMLKFALGDPLPHDLDQLRKDLASSNQAVVIAAQNAITNDLHLTLDGFAQMMAIRDKDAQNDPGKKPTAAEYAVVEALLTKAWKIRVAHPQWINDETNAFTTEGQTAGDPFIAYWRLRKAALPRWRATVDARRLWQQTLQARSAQPIIDPDIIDEYDFRDLVPDPKTAYGIRQARWGEIAGRISGITTTPPQTKDDLDNLFQDRDYLGLKTDDLFAVDQDRSVGNSIRGRLDQLGLSNAAFDTLLRVSKLVVNGQPVLPSEWMDVASILAQSFKKKEFANWRLEERGAATLLSPDFFQARPSSTDMLSPAPVLPAWRATIADRRDWQDTLQSRIDEQNSTIDGMRQAVSGAEAANLRILRDGLVMAAAAAGGSDQDRTADWVTKRFLIDAKMDSFQTTTRVEQAIETLQSLLLALSSAPFNPSGFEMAGGIAAVKGPDTIDIFGRGADNALWRMSGDGDSNWSDWESLGSVFSFDPAVCSSSPGRLDVFALRPDSAAPLRTDPHVWQRTFQNGVWSDWRPVGAAAGNNLGTVAAASWGPDTIDVFVSEVQTDGRSSIKHAHFENNVWSAWEIVPGSSQKVAPGVASRGFQRLDLFALGINDHAVWHLEYDNGWKNWEFLGGVGSSTPSPCAPSPTQLSVFIRGTDMALYQDNFVEGSGWSGWTSLGGVLSSGPSAVALSPARMDVFVRGGEAQLWHRRSLSGIWGEWAPIILVPMLTLQAASFSEDWKWLGSYAKWRAAMLVFLYPENLLLPTLRPPEQQTPGFAKVQKALGGGAVTRRTACDAAKIYIDYFEDVTNIIIEATCQTLAPVSSTHDCCRAQTATTSSYLLFMFGRGPATNKIYWSLHDPQAPPDYAQTFWTELSASLGEAANSNQAQIVRLIGAEAFRPSDSPPCIALFAHVQNGGNHSVLLLKFDIDARQVNGEPIPLGNVTTQGDSFTAVLRMDDESKNYPPYIGIQRADGSMWVGKLASDLSGWASSPAFYWNPRSPNGALLRLEALDDGGPGSQPDVFHGVYDDASISQLVETGYSIVPKPDSVSNIFGSGLFHGVVCLPNRLPIGPSDADRAFFYFTRLATGDPNIVAKVGGVSASLPGILQIQNVVPHGGYSLDPATQQQVEFVYEETGAQVVGAARLAASFRPSAALPGSDGSIQSSARLTGPFRRCAFAQSVSASGESRLDLAFSEPVHPVTTEDFFIPCEPRPEQLQAHRKGVQDTFVANFAAPASALTYLEEAFYFVPLYIALQLQRSGAYEDALAWFRTIYDYTAPKGDGRKIYYGLKQEESVQEIYQRPDNWLSNPLNPHAIAKIRGNTYTRFTLLCIVRCLLDYADSEFSQDTGESVARARNLYQTSLDLLDTDVLKQGAGDCAILSGALNGNTGAGISSGAPLARLKTRLANISERDRLRDTVVRIQAVLTGYGSPDHRFVQADRLAAQAEAESVPPVMREVLSESQDLRRQLYLSVARKPNVEAAAQKVGEAVGADFTQAVAKVTNLTTEQSDSEPVVLPWLRVTSRSGVNAMDGTGAANLATLETYQRFQIGFAPSAAALWGCIPPNPAPASLRHHAEVNLRKIRSGRNIAGMIRNLDPYAAPTNTTSALPTIGAGGQINLPGVVSIQPTLYRYTVLIERAKQLTQTAIQMEAAMLAALEKRDDKAYNLLKARQDLSLSQANVALQNLKVNEANDRVKLANLQTARIGDQIDYYTELLNDTTSQAYKDEQQSLEFLRSASDNLNRASDYASYAAAAFGVGSVLPAIAGASQGASIASNLASGASQAVNDLAVGVGAALGGVLGAASGVASGLSAAASSYSSIAGRDSTNASIMSTVAAYERRRREWQYQLQLSKDDAAIGSQQVTIAQDDVGIATQEQSIAELQSANAKDVVEFLTNEFTNDELFDWMSGILEQVYSYFLRQASAMAKLAENQVAFERQQTPTGFIQPDYWEPPADIQSTGGSAGPDRKGLTGAERLLEDITQLDQFAFLSDTRKLQLVKTFSLGRLAPAEFQRFREAGVMTFNTPMELFDRDFPGHYLRLISRVRSTVIALIPPNQGISATLSSSGLSRIVIGGDVFQTVPVRRQPESVALSSPMSATGVSELNPQSNTMLLPFEDTGVDTTWEFRMEKASNLFDYGAIADVLVTIEYTALSSLDYRQQVIKSLSPTVNADRPYSFRNQFPDQWYELHNPDQSSTPMTVRFTTFAEDFPPNIDDIRIQQVLLYFSRADGQTFEVSVTSLRFTAQDAAGAIGGGATSIDGVISTRRGNAGSWIPMIGKHPFGEWELSLPDTEDLRAHFNNDDIQEILFIITYTGNTPERPS